MSCGLTKLATSRNGRSASASPARSTGVAVLQPGDDTSGDQRVAAHAGVGERRTVRLGADPAREPVRAEWVGVEIALHGGFVDVAVVVVGGDDLTGRRVDQVGVADVPLAVVVRVVAGGAEPVAERRHLALGQPAQPRVVVQLAEPVGLGHAVQVGVLAGEQRRPARHAGQANRCSAVGTTRRVSANHLRPVSVSSRHARSSSDSYGGVARSWSVMITITSGRVSGSCRCSSHRSRRCQALRTPVEMVGRARRASRRTPRRAGGRRGGRSVAVAVEVRSRRGSPASRCVRSTLGRVGDERHSLTADLTTGGSPPRS